MFDNIHFYEFQNQMTFNEKNMFPYFSRKDHRSPDDPIVSRIGGLDTSFLIRGTLRYLPHHPISAHALANYLHVVSFGLMDVGEDFFTKRKAADSFLLLYTYGGNGLLEYEGSSCHLQEGTGFWIDCQKPHYYRTSGKHWYYSALHFDGPCARDLYESFSAGGKVMFSSPQNGDYQRRLERLLQIYDTLPNQMELKLSRELYLILTDLILSADASAPLSAGLSEQITYLIRHMEHNYARPWTLDDLAAFAGTSKYHLCREFHKRTGFSPISYLMQIRMENAKFLLKNTDLPVGKIGSTVGIDNQNAFIYQFKKAAGTTPGAYRKGL